MTQSSYLLEEMYLRDLHSAHQELANHISRTGVLWKAWKFTITLPSPLSLKKVKKLCLLSVAVSLYLGVYDKCKHISSNNDISSQFFAVNFL